MRSCLKLGLRFSVAEYIATGMETSPKLMAPFQIDRGIHGLYGSRCDYALEAEIASSSDVSASISAAMWVILSGRSRMEAISSGTSGS